MKKRARRRRELIKRKQRWLRITPEWWSLTPNEVAGLRDPLEDDEETTRFWKVSLTRHWSPEHPAAHAFACAQRRARTPAMCSCMMCGNPRRWFGAVTRQEKRSLDQLEYQLRELGEMGFSMPVPGRNNRMRGKARW
jgi:hypothetical protein